MLHITIEIDAQESAAVIGTERNLATGIGADGTETQIGIAIGDALPEDGVPKQHAGLGTLPCIVHNLLPQLAG